MSNFSNIVFLKSKIGYYATDAEALCLRNYCIELGFESAEDIYDNQWPSLVKKALETKN